MKDQSQEAGDDSNQYQAGRDMEVHHHHHGLTIEQIDELKKYVDGQVVGEVERFVDQQLEVLRADFVKFTGEANEQAMGRAGHLLTMFVEQLAIRAPENIGSMKSVAMQQSILHAQTSAAVADDEDLTQTLVDILVDKSSTGPRSFKGVVLNEALNVAGKLTSDQVNLLTALVMIRHTITHNLCTVDGVLAQLDVRCGPLYGKIPTTNSALQYMAYTGVGDIERLGHRSIADTIVRTYDGVFTQGFTVDQLPDGLKPVSANLPQVDERIRLYPDRLRFPVASAETLDWLRNRGELNEPFLTHIDGMKPLIEGNLLPADKFIQVLDAEKPNLSQFVRDLEQIGAPSFMLSSVGIALGQANWRRLLPDDAPDVDIYLG